MDHMKNENNKTHQARLRYAKLPSLTSNISSAVNASTFLFFILELLLFM